MLGQTQSKQAITVKIVFFYIVLVLDIFGSSLIESHFSQNTKLSTNNTDIPLLIIQMVITLLLSLSFFILLWQVFPLREAMIGELWKFFKWPMSLSLIYFGVTVAERTIRLVTSIKHKKEVDELLWNDDTLYQFFYYIRFLLQPFYYAVLIDGSMKLSLPEFYKPQNWIQK